MRFVVDVHLWPAFANSARLVGHGGLSHPALFVRREHRLDTREHAGRARYDTRGAHELNVVVSHDEGDRVMWSDTQIPANLDRDGELAFGRDTGMILLHDLLLLARV
jgi:hypothetical protein